jgi:hypothetical protein
MVLVDGTVSMRAAFSVPDLGVKPSGPNDRAGGGPGGGAGGGAPGGGGTDAAADAADGAGRAGLPIPMENDAGRAGSPCVPRLVVDGSPYGGTMRDIPSTTVKRVEAFWGANVPAEFAGAQAACGVILVWTR